MHARYLMLGLVALVAVSPVRARDLEESPAPFSLTPLPPETLGVPLASGYTRPAVMGAPMAPGTPVGIPRVEGSALASFNGYYYPSHSVVTNNSSDLLANTDGRVFRHPAFHGHLMYYNSNEGRWCYQDNRSMTGWFFVPREIYLAPPGA